MVSSLTEKRPNTQVSPNKGIITAMFHIVALSRENTDLGMSPQSNPKVLNLWKTILIKRGLGLYNLYIYNSKCDLCFLVKGIWNAV